MDLDDHLLPDEVTWRLVSQEGRVVTYGFAHETLGELGRIVIRPVYGTTCMLECQCAGGGSPETAAERRAQLIRLGEFIRKVIHESSADDIPDSVHRLH
jgi:hypothetical protein